MKPVAQQHGPGNDCQQVLVVPRVRPDWFSMFTKLYVAVVISVIAGLTMPVNSQTNEAAPAADASAMEFKNLSDLKWDKVIPDLGDDSPEICVLRVDPKTQATQLLIRTPKAIHVRKHWHTANESH